jgi:hypothetical protein
VPQDSGCTFLHKCTMAAVTCKYLYKLSSCRECYGGYGHVHILSTSFSDGTLGSVRIPNIIDPFDWFIPSLLDELV